MIDSNWYFEGSFGMLFPNIDQESLQPILYYLHVTEQTIVTVLCEIIPRTRCF